MTPGRALYVYKRKFGHGFKTAWLRDVFRKRILSSAPATYPEEAGSEIHVLTCQYDWLNLIWTLKSLFTLTDCRFPLVIHEDGSLNDEQVGHLRRIFPQARIVRRPEADRSLSRVLDDFPQTKKWRDWNPLALKVVDFAHYLSAPRLFLLDSDILFFSNPKALLDRHRDQNYKLNSLNKDWRYGYSVQMDQKEVKELPFPFPELINSGLGLIHKGVVTLQKVEYYLGFENIFSHKHRTEQTLIALCCAEAGFEFLPSEYDVTLEEKTPLASPVRHYVGEVRHLMYREGMSRLKLLVKQ